VAELTDFAVALRSGIALDQVFDGRVKVDTIDVVARGIDWQHGEQREQMCRGSKSGLEVLRGIADTRCTWSCTLCVSCRGEAFNIDPLSVKTEKGRLIRTWLDSALCPSAVPKSGHCPGILPPATAKGCRTDWCISSVFPSKLLEVLVLVLVQYIAGPRAERDVVCLGREIRDGRTGLSSQLACDIHRITRTASMLSRVTTDQSSSWISRCHRCCSRRKPQTHCEQTSCILTRC
jgi:hypothetical protein